MYTRRGDKGETSLYGGKRVRKDSPRVEAYGAIDELNSFVGLVAASTTDQSIVSSLEEVQRMLFVAGADAASRLDSAGAVTRISASDTARLEAMTDSLLKELPRLTNFVLPGGTITGAMLHVARSVCRRAERRLVTASKAEEMNPELIPFFNRLSTFFFDLARGVNFRGGKSEPVWKP